MLKKILLFAFTVVTLVEGQLVLNGNCPDQKVVQNFDFEKYSGKWFEVYRHENLNQWGADCVIISYTYNNTGGTKVLELTNLQYINHSQDRRVGSLTLAEDAMNGEAKLTISYANGNKSGSPYWVLNTDYANHALIYSCTQLENQNRLEYSWILSRSLSLNPTSVFELTPVLEESGLRWENYRETDQDLYNNCV